MGLYRPQGFSTNCFLLFHSTQHMVYPTAVQSIQIIFLERLPPLPHFLELYIYFNKPVWIIAFFTFQTSLHTFADEIPWKSRKNVLSVLLLSGSSYCTLVYLWEIYIFPGSVCLFCCREICGLILGIYKSLTDTWMWKLGLRTCNSQKRNT